MSNMIEVLKARCEDSEESVEAVLDRFFWAVALGLPSDAMNTLLRLTALAHSHKVKKVTVGQFYLKQLTEHGLIVIDADGTVILPAS